MLQKELFIRAIKQWTISPEVWYEFVKEEIVQLFDQAFLV